MDVRLRSLYVPDQPCCCSGRGMGGGSMQGGVDWRMRRGLAGGLRALARRQPSRGGVVCSAGEGSESAHFKAAGGTTHGTATASGLLNKAPSAPQPPSPTAAAASLATAAPDYYRQAGHRLQNLLLGVGDGEDELMMSLIEEQTPREKIFLSLIAGSAITGAALFLCWLGEIDPLGAWTRLLDAQKRILAIACACGADHAGWRRLPMLTGRLPHPAPMLQAAPRSACTPLRWRWWGPWVRCRWWR